MRQFNVDEEAKTRFEPIQLTLEGVEYTISVVPSEVIEAATDGVNNMGSLRNVLAGILGIDPSQLRGIDMRKLTMAVNYVMDALTEQIGEITPKNVPGGSAAPTQ